jgi:hypothetical protein
VLVDRLGIDLPTAYEATMDKIGRGLADAVKGGSVRRGRELLGGERSGRPGPRTVADAAPEAPP